MAANMDTEIPEIAFKSANQSGSSSSTSSSNQSTAKVKLQRTMGLPSGIGITIGCIIGSGIFVSPKGVLIQSESIGLSLVIWAVCGVVTLLGAHSFAELGTMITKSGGLYNYLQDAFGDLLAFVYLWASLVIAFPAANAAIAIVFAENVLQPVFRDCETPVSAVKLLAACAIVLLTYVNCSSVRWSTYIQNVFTVIKLLALVLIIITGLVLLAMGRTGNFENSFAHSTTDPGKIVLAFYSGLFSYSGWYSLNFLVEELKSPYKNLPRAIWVSMPLITLIYVLANVAYFVVLTPRDIIESDAVAVTFAERVYGIGSLLMPVFVACSTFGSLNGCIMSVSRLFFVGAREGHLPEVLALIHIKRFTPMPAVLFEGALSVLFLLADDVFVLINYVSFVEALSFLACTAGLFYLRYTKPDEHRPIRVSLFFPAVFLLVCVLLAVIPIYYSPGDVLVGIIICLSGIPVYMVAVLWKRKPKSFRKTLARYTHICQKVMFSVPEEGKGD